MPDAPEPSEAPAPLPAGWRERVELLGAASQMTPARLAGGAVGVVVAVVVVVLVLRGPPPPAEISLPMVGGPGDPALTSTTASATTVVTQVLVHAAGAVHTPGVYRLGNDARVADLVEAAGGPLPESDLDGLNLAAALVDGQRVYVPRVGEAVPPELDAGTAAGAGAGARAGIVDVNTASAEQLDTLPGVGPATAQAILDERARRGRFSSVEDLLDVRGIGEAKLEALRHLVRV